MRRLSEEELADWFRERVGQAAARVPKPIGPLKKFYLKI